MPGSSRRAPAVLAQRHRLDRERRRRRREPGVAAHVHGGRAGVGRLAGEREAPALHAEGPADRGGGQPLALQHRTLLDVQFQVGGQAVAPALSRRDPVEIDSVLRHDLGQPASVRVAQLRHGGRVQGPGDGRTGCGRTAPPPRRRSRRGRRHARAARRRRSAAPPARPSRPARRRASRRRGPSRDESRRRRPPPARRPPARRAGSPTGLPPRRARPSRPRPPPAPPGGTRAPGPTPGSSRRAVRRPARRCAGRARAGRR
jgi:hypothetical protein